jgi:hypothetical protein
LQLDPAAKFAISSLSDQKVEVMGIRRNAKMSSTAMGWQAGIISAMRNHFDGAIYHVMYRGNARKDIVHDEDD